MKAIIRNFHTLITTSVCPLWIPNWEMAAKDKLTTKCRRVFEVLSLAIAVHLGCAALSGHALAQTISKTGFEPGPNAYELDNKVFSAYQTLKLQLWSMPTPPVIGVNRGCGQMQFTANITINASPLESHTFTVNLKKDGTQVQTAHRKFGPAAFSQQVIFVKFNPVDFAPGTWTIDWTFQIKPTQSDSGSITLIAPILAAQAQNSNPDLNNLYCNRGSFPAATYVNGACNYRAIPSTGFIFGNKFYTKYNACSRGISTGTACLLGAVPAGMFTWNGAYYYPGGSNKCVPPLLPGSAFDGANCYIASTAVAFTSGGKFYIKYDSCLAGTNDKANCLLAQPPAGTTAGATGNEWYWTPLYCK